jgi:hypothetical protein
MQDFVNKNFGRWTVVSYIGKKETERHWYEVECKCGNKSIVERNILKRGKSTQCKSCARKISCSGEKNPSHKHGYSSPNHPYFHIYNIWCSMKARCLNPKNKGFKSYGGRGIKICEKWIDSFEEFFSDMGIPEIGFSLDRIDVNGNYCKENCRWANKETQANNCRTNIYYELTGEKLSETQWARKLGLSRNKFMWWTRKYGFQWVLDNIEVIKKTSVGMSDYEYLEIGLDLPDKKYRKAP